MSQFRRLAWIALLSGTIAGLVLFALQHWTVIPVIEQAEAFETAAQHALAGHVHDDEGWQPADGPERVGLTALTTVLAGIAFASLLVSLMSLDGRPIDTRSGALWGLAGFACCVLAPALSMPPLPPGVEAADLTLRQSWWLGTALATALGLHLLLGRERTWLVRLAGLPLLALPHLIGAPAGSYGSAVPADLVRSFAIASVLTNAVFWLLLGGLAGFLQRRQAAAPA